MIKEKIMSNKKKILILVGMFALLVVTAVLNYTIAANASKNKDGDTVATGNFFTNYRTERIATRNEEIAYLDTIIANQSADYIDARTAAMEQKMKIINNMDLEMTLESLIKAGGFDEAVVTIGVVSNNVNIIVKTEAELTKAQVANIYTIVYEETKISPDLVRIIPV